MNDLRIEQLADDIAAELSQTFQGFSLVSAHCIGATAVIRYRWRHPPQVDEDYTITVLIWDSDTDESVKTKIRRQITDAVAH